MKRPSETSCEAALEQLEAFVDGDLAAVEAAVVEAHLSGCGDCTAEHALALAVRRELRAFPELDAPSAVLAEISRGAERARFRRRVRVWQRPVRTRAVAAVFAALVIGAGLWWGRLLQAPVEHPPLADAAAVAQATEEARYALAYLTRVHRRAGLKLRDDLFVERVARPSARSLARSLSPSLRTDAGGEGGSDSDRS